MVSQNNLAMQLSAGQGVPKNETEAAQWFRKAAEQGVPGAQTNFGLLLARGHGVPQDYVEAFKFFNLAAAQGHANGAKNRDLIAPEMTKDQIAEGQKRATLFSPKREPGL